MNGANAFLNQFNVVMAYIQLDNAYYVLDASDKLSNYKLTPERIVNTRAFLLEGWAGRVIDVIDNNHHFSMTVAVKGDIDDKGMLAGEANIISEDYARKERVERLTKNPDAFKQDYFIKAYPALSFEEISIKNQEYDSLPLSQKVKFTMPLNSSEGYSYFTTNLFSDFESNPFIMDQRNTDVDFGSQQKYTIYGNFTIPEGYSFDALPQNMNLKMPGRGADFSRVMEAKGNILNVVIKINFHRTYYPVTDYADFREFYKKLLAGLNEQVVIKKKS